jgi:hypothetical protein
MPKLSSEARTTVYHYDGGGHLVRISTRRVRPSNCARIAVSAVYRGVPGPKPGTLDSK